MNTTSNIKNMTEVEINNRINEINNILDKNIEEVLDPMMNDVESTINNILHETISSDFNIDLDTDYSRLVFEDDSFHHIDIVHKYEYDYKTDENKEWVFKMNISSCGTFKIIGTPDDNDEKNIVRYYMTIAKILMNEELKNKLSGIIKNWKDDVQKNRDNMKIYDKELRALQNELNIRKTQKEINENASKSLSEEAKELYTIIDFDTTKYPANAIYRKQPVVVVKAPTTRKALSYFYMGDSCKIVKCSTLKSL